MEPKQTSPRGTTVRNAVTGKEVQVDGVWGAEVHGWRTVVMGANDVGDEFFVDMFNGTRGLKMTFVLRNGALLCTRGELNVVNDDELLGNDLRRLPFGHLVGAAKTALLDYAQIHDKMEEDLISSGASAGWTEPITQALEGGRRRPIPDHVYAALAADYVRLLESGSRKPVADLARLAKFSDSSIRERLKEARKRGLLTSAGQGRAQGALTAKAETLLNASPERARR